VLDEQLVDFDDPERSPLVRDGVRGSLAGDEAHSANRFDEARPAHEPAVGLLPASAT
jgi:hypothetical protein